MTMTTQQIFDAIVAHFVEQVEPSFDILFKDDGPLVACRYRDDAGRKCAVGALIPDVLYSRALEGNGMYSFGVAHALSEAGVLSHDDYRAVKSGHYANNERLSLLSEMQSAHDRAATAPRPRNLVDSEMHDELRKIAKNHNLTFNG